jgi:uncharacterized protein (DUF1499 family)
MNAAWLSFFDGLLAVTLIAIGAVGAHFYIVPSITGFGLFAFGFLLSLIGSIAGIVAIFRTRKPERSAGRNRALVGSAICLAIAIPFIVTIARGMKYPAINDITTDFDNPPEFVNAQKLQPDPARDMKYDKAMYAAKQTIGYGAINPLKERLEPSAAFQRVTEVAQSVPSWKITYSDPAKNTLEAVSTSTLFHFQDDIVIVIRPTPDGESLIEMRSKSRDGKGDFGINAKRIRRFFDRVALARGKVNAQTDTDQEPPP